MDNIYTVTELEGVSTFLWAGRFISTEGWQHKKRTSNFHEIILVLSGILYIQIGDISYAAKKNTLLLVPQGTLHYGTQTCPDNTSFYWFHFLFPNPYKHVTDEELPTILETTYPYRNTIILPHHSTDIDFSRLNILGNQLLDIQKRNENNRFYLNLLMTSLLVEITEECVSKCYHNNPIHNESKTLSYMTEWIKASLENELSLEIIADKFNYNHAYLSRMFSKEMGVTLTEYIRSLRLERAKSLLSNLSISISEVATLCGFHDEKYFMRCFKQQELMSASQYREAFNKSHINNK